jgi:hypothetical protein
MYFSICLMPKAAGRREAKRKQFNLDRSQSYHLLQNRVSEEGTKGYIKCLESENTGLRMRLAKHEGSLYTVAIKVKPQGTGDFRWKKLLAAENFKMLSAIDTNEVIDPNTEYTFTFKRLNDRNEGLIEMGAGKLRDQLLFPPVPQLVQFERDVYASTGYAKATSCGQDGHKNATHCEPVPAGWRFVLGTGVGIPKEGYSEGAAGKVEAVKITPEQACVVVWAYTGDEQVCRTFEGGFTVVKERPVPAASQPAQPSQPPPAKKKKSA